MTRIAECFARLATENRAALISFVMAGDPDLEHSAQILRNLPKDGVDLIELGMPFSDPMADGKTIEAAGLRALAAGATLPKILAMVEHFRQHDSVTPIILMGYFNPIYRFGAEKFCRRGASRGCRWLDYCRFAARRARGFMGSRRQFWPGYYSLGCAHH